MGAGPGDPELLTIKAMRYLQQAEVVLADRLVSPEIISNYISPSAEIIMVGKQCRKGASTPQATINELMVHHARQGRMVVRLKGGDVSIFSNILDELSVLLENNLKYEIIPGVTAALGAAAYSAIPLTARGYSTGVRFLTYYKSDVIEEKYWKELADTEDTLVFYMSAETLPGVVSKLVEYSIDPEKLLAIVEQATTPGQQVTIASLYNYKDQLEGRTLASPSLIIIGRVVALHRQFKWLEQGNGSEYFLPVAARVIDHNDSEIQKLLTA